MLTIKEQNAKTIAAWIETRQGIKVWRSIDLSDPGKEILTPKLSESGEETGKPHWSMGNDPAEIITDISSVNVSVDREVKRFHVAVRLGAQGMKLKCTDASSARIRRECAKWEGSRYEFDYDTQECVIFAPLEIVSLADYLKRN